jgi:hypothetical protein
LESLQADLLKIQMDLLKISPKSKAIKKVNNKMKVRREPK